jgi:GxxExxY protein
MPLRIESTLDKQLEELATRVLDAAFKVHQALGPGLLESVYEACLCHELHLRGIPFERQVSLPIVYEGLRLESGLRLDVLVDKRLIVELKSVEQLTPLFGSQLLTHLKLSDRRLGLLINFNVTLFKDGLRRVVN